MKGKRVSNSKNKNKNKKRKWYLILIIIVFIWANISGIHKYKTKTSEDAQVQETAEDEYSEEIINKLADMNERDRMEYYLAIFINNLESKNYESAYNLLYDEFKKTYFPTLDEFKSYAEKTFPNLMNIEHENIERNGDIYVLWIYVSDMVNGGPEDKKAINVVIREDDLNKFVLSFSVI